MSRYTKARLGRRDFLRASAAAGAITVATPALLRAQAAEINFQTWSAAVDTVQSHLAAFTAETGCYLWQRALRTISRCDGDEIRRWCADGCHVGVRRMAA